MEEPIVTKLFRQRRETEIGDFKVFVFVEEKILWFEITVGYSSAVAVINGTD